MRNKLLIALAVALLVGLLVAGCAGPAPTEEVEACTCSDLREYEEKVEPLFEDMIDVGEAARAAGSGELLDLARDAEAIQMELEAMDVPACFYHHRRLVTASLRYAVKGLRVGANGDYGAAAEHWETAAVLMERASAEWVRLHKELCQ